MYCEDYPCCGHGNEGCLGKETVNCASPNCYRSFYPSSSNEKYCNRCNALHEIAVENNGPPDWVDNDEE